MKKTLKRRALAGTVLLMALLLTLSLAACTDGAQTGSPSGDEGGAAGGGQQTARDDEAFALWKTASETNQTASSLSFTMGFDMSLEESASGEGLTMNMSGPVQIAHASDPTQMQMSMDLRVSSMGQDLTMQAWYRDGYYYFDTMGMQFKQQMSGDEALSQNKAELLFFAEDAIREQSVTEREDGGQELSFVLDGTQMTELVDEALASSLQNLDVDPSSLAIEVQDVVVTARLDANGALLECIYAFTATLASEGVEMALDYRTVLTDISYDEVTINFPDGLDSYAEAPTS
ncbi:MAG: hypothetical protein LBO07_00235 [Coriobacteriales bacterium]|jgi:hypothetical protein|nr:hypothetical protein [Coriobacteriales bacterium]